MLSYCLVCKRNTENKDAKMIKTKNSILMLSSKSVICGNKKSRFMKEQEAKGLLSNLGIKISLSKIPLLGDLFFSLCNKMNAIVNKFLLSGEKFMPEMHLRQPGFTYLACGPFTKHKQRIQKFMQTGDTNYICRNELDKACFQHDAADSYSKDLVKRTQSDKVLENKAFAIANNSIYDGYQRGLASMAYKFFDKKSKGDCIKNEIKENQESAKELHKPIIRKFKKRKVYSSFKDNIWGVDLADMQLISNYNKGIRHLLCAIDLFSKYAFVVPLKDKKGVTITNAFQSILDKSKRKPNKI